MASDTAGDANGDSRRVEDAPPAQPTVEHEPTNQSIFSRVGGHFTRFWQTVLTAGFLIWGAIAVLLVWSSGVIDNFRGETPGILHIESPQIYTRERLVNDRFREQAWLEKQLKELEGRAELISSYRKERFSVSVKSAPTGVEPADTPPTPQPSGKSDENLEEKLLVSADDSFNLQRNMRATIRRALIENELDDRHDLGSNSLYQFNFGAAIIASSRTRRVAAIEMEIDPVKQLQPLNALVKGDAVCSGLREYECAFLFDTGVLDLGKMSETESQTIEKYLEQYNLWKQLFNRWLGAENSAYKREAADVRELLSSPEASERIRNQMQPFFDNLNRQATRFIESFENVSGSKKFNSDNCKFSSNANGKNSIEIEILTFIQGCITETNIILSKRGNDLRGVENFFKVKLDTDPNSLAILRTSETDNKISLGEYMWGEYFLQVFGEFNDQCSWPDGDDLIRKQTRSRSAQVTTSKTAAGEGLATGTVTTSQNFAAPDSDALGYELTKQVESSLLNCISRSVIRDYGSHPFSRVERETQIATRNTGSRSDHSSYRAQRGLSSIVVTNKKNEFRANQRTEYIGVASRYTANTTDNGLEEYPHKLSKLNRTCRGYGLKDSDEELKIPDDDSHVLLAGVSSLFAFDTLAPLISLEVGWNLLGHLICDAHVSEPADENAPFLVNKKHTLPIGLFRFIDLLSTSQRTFSYSVQPSGAFSLQRRDRDTSWSLSNIFDGAKRRDQIAAGGDTTESWIEKQYRIIGFGTQRDPVDNEPGSPSEKQRKAKFGWYVFPSSSPGGWYSRPVIQSANIKLSALVSLPAWWQNVNITVTTSWRHPDAPGKPASFGNVNDEASYEENFRVELPTRLEFIRNHFPDSAANRPSLYQLQLPKVTLRACEEANIVLKGERLWRSTVVTLGSQRSSLIQVMPDMRGIIAHFDNVLPLGVSPKNRKADADTGQRSDDAGAAVQSDGDLWIDTVPVTVWTSEGQKSVVDTVSVAVPDTVSKSISEGRPPCKKPDKSDG